MKGWCASIAKNLVPWLLSLTLHPFLQASVMFSSSTPYNVGNNPSDIAVGDFTGNGVLDIAVTATNDNEVNVLLGNGDGTFKPPVSYWTWGNAPTGLVIGDFTGNGFLDIAASNTDSNSVAFLFGNGDGTFQWPVTYGVWTKPKKLAAGSFSSLGYLDLAVPNADSTMISILYNIGNGYFGSTVIYEEGSDNPQAIATGAFTGDRKLDLAVVNRGNNTVTIWLKKTYCSPTQCVDYFYPYLDIPVGNQPNSVAVGDFNGNGILDLAVANGGSDSVSVLFGDGKGNFSGRVDYSVGKSPQGIVVADIRGKGILDILTANNGGGSISILEGNGKGSFAASETYLILASPDGTQPQPVSLAVGDFNGDGYQDLAVVCHADSPSVINQILIMLQKPAQASASLSGSPPFLSNRNLSHKKRGEGLKSNFLGWLPSTRRSSIN